MTNSRAKGAAAEREIVHQFLSVGVLCRRTAQYCGNSGEAADVQCVGLALHVEVKRTEKLRLADAVVQCERDSHGKPWVIAYRASRMPWLVIQTFDQWSRDSIAMREARAERIRLMDTSDADTTLHP